MKTYFADLAATAERGDAREESFYSALSDLLAEFAASTGRDEIHVTTLPKRTEAGNPDFRVWNGRDRVVGYIEAKRPTETDLDRIEDSEQLERYRKTFPNLILTNFCEFRLYRDGEPVDAVGAARPFVLNRLGEVPPVEGGDELLALFETFFEFSLPRSFTAESLAEALAKRTRFLRDVVSEELRREREAGEGTLLGFYEAFQSYLIAGLEPDEFADLYAQTITYGLFAARTRAGDEFSRRTAFDYIPRTIGILRDVFEFISLGDPPEQIEWIVDDIAEVLAVADAGEILDRYYREGKGGDPVVHFYETFLGIYDPEERERRGVYYTPEPVVSYIVRSLHELLKADFGMADGLASAGVTLVDPAAGTMTFVARACEEAVREFEETYGAGGRDEFIRDHILQNFYAFELMMAPYAIGHLKMAFYLEELGHRLRDDERFPLYLTNTLEAEELDQTNLPGMRSLAHESHLAGEVKKQTPILVVLGNPPYSVRSANRSNFVEREMKVYKDPVRDEERNLMPLSDDYVKFLRFAQWKIDQAGHGVVGMITNHSYLDNPTFRGMRESLLESFDEIRVLNLHGNSLKRERAPDGGKDENVFDIRQGVAIVFLRKHHHGRKKSTKVFHADVWGRREDKYEWLAEHDIGTTAWEPIKPRAKFFMFQPHRHVGSNTYQQFTSLADLFETSSTGVKTHRDHFAISFAREEIERRIRTFRDLSLPNDVVEEVFNLRNTAGWNIDESRAQVGEDAHWKDKVVSLIRHPFDYRWIFYHQAAIDRGRQEIMRHLLAGENVALIAPKQHKQDFGAFVTDTIGPHKALAMYDTNYYFPLYLYPDTTKHDLFSQLETKGERRPNLNSEIVAALTEAHGREPSPEQIFHYVYAVLYAPTYRAEYSEFLEIDFPRVPFASDRGLFEELAALGKRLAGLHLLRSPELDEPIARFEGEGEVKVARTKQKGRRYEPDEERVYINKEQYFAPVALGLWEYTIGGYQVLDKWLKDRRERRLTLEEIRTYCRIVTALAGTVEVQEEIDARYARVDEGVTEWAGY